MTTTRPGPRDLVRGVAWNHLGQLLPILAAVVLVPRLVHGLGADRFGVLSLAWMVIGYFTLFDLGVSGALTRMVSERLAAGERDEVPPLIWTSLALTVCMGALGGLVLAGIAPWLIERALRIPVELREEALRLTWTLAATLPVVTGTAALTGVLAAQQRFGLLNLIRVPLGVLTYAAPVLVLPFSTSLVPAGIALSLVRLAAGVAYLAACLASTPGLGERVTLRRGLLRPVLSFGGWMTVSAVVGPFMVYLDRFLIGGMLSMAMVAYYTTPFDLVSRLGILSLPVVNVLFPAIAASFTSDRVRAARMVDWGVRAVGAMLFPFTLVLALFSAEILRVWIGPDFAIHGAPVLRLMAIGMFMNALAQVMLAVVQSTGRPDLAARLHVIELPFYLGALVMLVRRLGIEGAAIAWLARVAVDTVALFVMARARLGPGARASRATEVTAIAGVAVMALGAAVPGFVPRVVYASVAIALHLVMTWFTVVRPGARAAGMLSA